MSKSKKISKKQSILINNKHDSFHYKIFVVFVLIGIIYYYFLNQLLWATTINTLFLL